MKIKKFDYYACDFETTVYDGQTSTEVWSACIAKLYSDEKPLVFGSIESFFLNVFRIKNNCALYFHNLKFDGAFIVDYLLRQGYEFNRVKESEMLNNQFKCAISDMGNWYTITIKKFGKIYEIRDSLKLLPFSLERIGKSFSTKHKKLEMEYTGYRYKNCNITHEELEYIINDVLVLKEALEITFNDGHDNLTIGSCCLKEFKTFYDKEDYNNLFPNLYELPCPTDYDNAGEYIRRSYKGGWCYLNSKKAGKIIKGGMTFDVNSLYPSMMHSVSGNEYPVGKPVFFKSNEFDKIKDERLYFVRIRCRFYLKEGYLPTIQIKGNYLYKGNEYLHTSDVLNKKTGKYYRQYIGTDGEIKESKVEIVLTKPDYERFLEHYVVEELEIIDGCWFYSQVGIFDGYINKYMQQKMTSKGAARELAKLYLNNLYGKEAANTDSSFKIPYLDEESNIVKFDLVEEHEKIPGYIAIGSYITSYARNFTIKFAQMNYANFIYADTDSIHLSGNYVKGIRIHNKNMCCWKKESEWDCAIFVRQKTYIERVINNGRTCKPYLDIKCAGMPDRCKKHFEKNYQIKDFKIGIELPGNLKAKRFPGGIVLVEQNYIMR